MGDRTYVTVVTTTAHKDAVGAVFDIQDRTEGDSPYGAYWEQSADGAWTVCLDGVNYGGYSDFEQLAKEGRAFVARQEGGGSYGPSTMVGWQGKFYDAPTTDSEYTVRLCADGAVDRKSLAHARAAQKAEQAFYAALPGPSSSVPSPVG